MWSSSYVHSTKYVVVGVGYWTTIKRIQSSESMRIKSCNHANLSKEALLTTGMSMLQFFFHSLIEIGFTLKKIVALLNTVFFYFLENWNLINYQVKKSWESNDEIINSTTKLSQGLGFVLQDISRSIGKWFILKIFFTLHQYYAFPSENSFILKRPHKRLFLP